MIEAALCWATRFKTTRRAAAIFRTSLITATVIVAAIIVTARLVAARFAALRRGVFGRREIATANARTLRRASAAMASPTAAPAAATTSVTAAISTPVSATIGATAVALAGTAAGAWSVVLRGIVVRRKILRRGGVGIRLALVGGAMSIVVAFVVNFGDMRVGDFAFGDGLLDDAGLGVVREGITTRRFFVE